MATIAEFHVPATDTVLATTFERVPEVSVKFESAVSKNVPSLWVSDAESETVEAAFEADPSVVSATSLAEAGDQFLYDVEFDDEYSIYEELLEAGGSLLEVRGSEGWWLIRMRFRDRDQLCATHDRLVEMDITATLKRVTDLENTTTTTDTRLTPEQQEALQAALEQGYFEIPRKISMEELAEDLGISHQALSERLRRGYETLVDAELQPSYGRS